MMKHKNYFGRVEYDDEAKIFHGEVIGIRDVITFQGTSVEELEQAFKDSVDEYLAYCKRLGEKPERTFSGKFNLRLDPELHAALAVQAKARGISLNTYIAEELAKSATKFAA